MMKKSNEPQPGELAEDPNRATTIAKGGVAVPFPWGLHKMLDVTAAEGLQHVVSWNSHGRAFTVHKPKEFAEKILPRFFSQTKYPSFQRQLNLYGFQRFAHGVDKGAYYHFCFIQNHPDLVRNMIRRKIKGTKVRRTPTEEPNFYHPAWKHHFGPTASEFLRREAYHQVPPTPHLKKAAAAVAQPGPATDTTTVAVVPASPVLSSARPRHHRRGSTTTTSTRLPFFVDILPAPSSPVPVAAPVSDEESSWDSLDLDAIAADASYGGAMMDDLVLWFEEEDAAADDDMGWTTTLAGDVSFVGNSSGSDSSWLMDAILSGVAI